MNTLSAPMTAAEIIRRAEFPAPLVIKPTRKTGKAPRPTMRYARMKNRMRYMRGLSSRLAEIKKSRALSDADFEKLATLVIGNYLVVETDAMAEQIEQQVNDCLLRGMAE